MSWVYFKAIWSHYVALLCFPSIEFTSLSVWQAGGSTLATREVRGTSLTTCRRLRRIVLPPLCRSGPPAPLIAAAEMLVLQLSDYRLRLANVSLSRFRRGYRQSANDEGISSRPPSPPDKSLVFQLGLRKVIHRSYLPSLVFRSGQCEWECHSWKAVNVYSTAKHILDFFIFGNNINNNSSETYDC